MNVSREMHIFLLRAFRRAGSCAITKLPHFVVKQAVIALKVWIMHANGGDARRNWRSWRHNFNAETRYVDVDKISAEKFRSFSARPSFFFCMWRNVVKALEVIV